MHVDFFSVKPIWLKAFCVRIIAEIIFGIYEWGTYDKIHFLAAEIANVAKFLRIEKFDLKLSFYILSIL